MNFKHIFPSFRNRYRFVKRTLHYFALQQPNQRFLQGLNIGTGEGDYDAMVANHCVQLTANDVNADDIAHARTLNAHVPNLHYTLGNALDLEEKTASIDLIISSEVIEHVGQPDVMVREIGRVLRPGGIAIMTFPSQEFPFTYDPINRVYHWVRGKKAPERLVAQGAYAFGHDYLIPSAAFRNWAEANQLEIVEWHNLSGPLVGLVEMYWTGIAQSLFKKNSKNLTEDGATAITVRPGTSGEPFFAIFTDIFLAIDRLFFGWWLASSLGKGVVLRKKGNF